MSNNKALSTVMHRTAILPVLRAPTRSRCIHSSNVALRTVAEAVKDTAHDVRIPIQSNKVGLTLHR